MAGSAKKTIKGESFGQPRISQLHALRDRDTIFKVLPLVQLQGDTPFTAMWILQMAMERGIFPSRMARSEVNRKIIRALGSLVKAELVERGEGRGIYLAHQDLIRRELRLINPLVSEVRRMLEPFYGQGPAGLREGLRQALTFLNEQMGMDEEVRGKPTRPPLIGGGAVKH